jgi:ABC-type uncharacterized transport system permease subunit
MTTLTVYSAPKTGGRTGFWTRSRRAGAVYVLLGLVAAGVFGALAKSGQSVRFTFGQTPSGFAVSIPSTAGGIAFGLLATLVGALLIWGPAGRWSGAATGVAVAGLVLSLVCSQMGGQVMPLGDVAQGTINLALPLILGALAGVLCERSGVVNVAIEGQFLTGAFAGALVATVFTSAWIGLVASMVGGLFIAALLAVLAIRYLVDQVVLGVVLNVFALGLTGFLYDQLMQPHAADYNNPPKLPVWTVPGLSKIPIIGPALFQANIFVYLALGLVVVIHLGLFHTRWGLRTRAVGEHPTAADTVGIRVRLVRYRNVLFGGLVAGLGGAFFTLGATGVFTKNMTNGNGFIALAALIFGRWSPVGALLAALLFGFSTKLQYYLGGSVIPNQFLAMLPYLATIVAVAGLVGRVRAPAADGKPYVKS